MSGVTLAGAKHMITKSKERCRSAGDVGVRASTITILTFKARLREGRPSDNQLERSRSSFNSATVCSVHVIETRVVNLLRSRLQLDDYGLFMVVALNNNHNTMSMISVLSWRSLLPYAAALGGNWIFSEVDWITSEIIVLNCRTCSVLL